MPSDRSQSYPGMHGALDIGRTESLSPTEQKALRVNVVNAIGKADIEDAFFGEIVHNVHFLRDLQRLDRERTVKERLAEADSALAALARGDSMPRLSQIGHRDLAQMRERFPNAVAHDLLIAVKAGLPKMGSGRAPDDALRLAAVMLAEAFRGHLPNPPSSSAGGPFVALLQVVAAAADGKEREGLHGVAEEALKIHVERPTPGVATFSRLGRAK